MQIRPMQEARRNKRWVLLLVLALVLSFVVSGVLSKPSVYAASMQSLDDKKATVMGLTATAMATSTALSLLPGDIATPIANQIAALSSYLVILLGVILVEKILLATMGFVSFSLLVPLACVLRILHLYLNRDSLRRMGNKLALFGIAISLVIPLCLHVSDLITDTYQHSVAQAMAAIEQNTLDTQALDSQLTEDERNWLERVGDSIADFASSIGSGVTDIVKKGEQSLGLFIDSIATLFVTCCVVPLGIALLFWWLVKSLFGAELRSARRAIADGHAPQARLPER